MIETLRLTRKMNRVQIEDIASSAKSTESSTRVALTNALISPDNGWISLNPRLRIRLALDIARTGRLGDSARTLTWQEFENFAEECLEEAGFQTEKNVRVRGDGRAWQIDVAGFRGDLVLSVDCKHWSTPGYLSRFKLAARHQKAATLHLLNAPKKRTILRENNQQALPVILTLSEPPSRFFEGVALVSIEKLPSFLSGVTPYDENLPFITSASSIVGKPYEPIQLTRSIES